MTKKLIYVISIFVFLTIISILNHSCERIFTYKATICDVNFSGSKNLNAERDTITGNTIRFLVTTILNTEICQFPNFSFIQNSYALTKCAKYQNEILTTSFQISFDRNLIISNDTVPANSNLFENQVFRSNTEIIKNDQYDCKYLTYEITLSPNLTSNVKFEPGIYFVNFICNTNDGKTFNKYRQIVFIP